MKNLFIVLCTLIAFNVSAQIGRNGEFRSQTPNTSSASQTHYIYVGGTTAGNALLFTDLVELNVIIKTDSLSGATAGTVTVEVCNDGDGTTWYPTSSTLTVNGAASQYLNFEDTDFNNSKCRVKIVNTSATQSNRMLVTWAAKRKL